MKNNRNSIRKNIYEKKKKNNVGNKNTGIALQESARLVDCDFGMVIDVLERGLKMVEDRIMECNKW